MLSIASLAVLAVVAAALWKLFRGYFVKSPFDNIPGPARSSLLQGTLQMYSLPTEIDITARQPC